MKAVIGFVLGVATAVTADYIARSVLAHAQMRREGDPAALVPFTYPDGLR